jgi:allophanate hydrolase subunit 1
LKILTHALLISLAGAILIAAGVTAWEWLENPSGIYHDATTTQWQIVYDTAISWFMPTSAYLFIFALLSQLIWRVTARQLARFRKLSHTPTEKDPHR